MIAECTALQFPERKEFYNEYKKYYEKQAYFSCHCCGNKPFACGCG